MSRATHQSDHPRETKREIRTEADLNDEQRDAESGEPVGVAPLGAKTEGEIEDNRVEDETDSLRIDPKSRIPRPVPPDLA